jgi:hypothetical protein
MPMSTLFQDSPSIQMKTGGMLDAQSQVAQTRGNELQNQQREQLITQQGIDNERANQDAARKQQANDILRQHVDMKTGDVDWKAAKPLVSQAHPEYALQLDKIMNEKRNYTQEAQIKDLESQSAKINTQVKLASGVHDQISYNLVYKTLRDIAEDNGTPIPPPDYVDAAPWVASAKQAYDQLSDQTEKTKQLRREEELSTPEIKKQAEDYINGLKLPAPYSDALKTMANEPGGAIRFINSIASGEIENINKRREPVKSTANTSKTDFSQEARLSGEFHGMSKDYIAIRNSYRDIKSLAKMQANDPNGANDVALIYKIAKMYDPIGVVRESDYDAVAKSGSIPQNIKTALSKAISGQKLETKVRENFVANAEALYRGAYDSFKQNKQYYDDRARAYGLSPELVTGGIELVESDKKENVSQENKPSTKNPSFEELWGK